MSTRRYSKDPPPPAASAGPADKPAPKRSARKPSAAKAAPPDQAGAAAAPEVGSAAGRRKPRARVKAAKAPAPQAVTAERRLVLIAEAAYYRAERRGFQPGGEMADWLEAEAEVEALLQAAGN